MVKLFAYIIKIFQYKINNFHILELQTEEYEEHDKKKYNEEEDLNLVVKNLTMLLIGKVLDFCHYLMSTG